MIKEFKDFLMRGNIVDLAVAVVIGGAFGLLVQSLVADLLTPLLAAIFGKPDFSNLQFTINGSAFKYGNFVNALIAFVSVAGAIFFFVVKPVNALEERRKAGLDPETKECPECLSEIPFAAKRCAHCASEVDVAASPGT